MKKLFAGTVLMLISFTATAQKSDSALREVEALKAENADLSKQNLYLKSTLDLLKPISSARADRLKFDVVKIVGSKKDKTLVIYYIFNNEDSAIRKFFQPVQAYFVDIQGNQVSTYDVFASAANVRVDNIEPNTPMKGVLKFKIEEVDFPIIKLLNLTFSNIDTLKNGLSSSVVFKNLPVNWLN